MSPDGKRICNYFASAGDGAEAMVTSALADEIVLATGGSMMCRGKLFNIHCERVTDRVYHLTTYDRFKKEFVG